ncbi:MAG: glycoside hydrolase family 25 protein [Lachnospiraceae bacterium]|nr:glycoside hydrolase family 25 protein [Lachnospiraceae bacterium]
MSAPSGSAARKKKPAPRGGSGARRAGSLAAILFLCVVTMLALTFCVFLLLRIELLQNDEAKLKQSVEKLNSIETEGYITESDALALIEEEREKTERETTSRILEWIKTQFGEGNSTAWVLRNLYQNFSNELVVGSRGSYFFFPVMDHYKKAIVSPAELKPDPDGILHYAGADPAVSGELGIDVSRYQGKIDWERVAADGVKYAFIRVGLRGSTEGKLVEDQQYADNIEGALDAGIKVGVYFYTQAVDEEEAVEEADFLLERIADYPITLPVVFDIEPTDSGESRAAGLSADQNTKNVLAFCSRVEDAGYTPMVYGGLQTFLMMLDMEQIEHLKKWFAFYDTQQYFPYEYSYWQFSKSGSVDGIEGDVDLNICIEDLAK